MNPPVEALLFDKDGTLVDFDRTWASAYAGAAAMAVEAFGDGSVTARDLLIAGGMEPETGRFPCTSVLACETTPEIAEVWAAMLGGIHVGPLAERMETYFLIHAGDRPQPVEGLSAALDLCLAAGLRLGVATMDSEAMAHRNLERMGITDRFDFVCGFDSGHGQKPGPGMLLAFAEHVGVRPDRIAMIGDSPHDLLMGRSAGAGLVVGVLTGTGETRDLAPISDSVLDSVASLPGLLGLG